MRKLYDLQKEVSYQIAQIKIRNMKYNSIFNLTRSLQSLNSNQSAVDKILIGLTLYAFSSIPSTQDF
jgi:hypothetical protein